MKEYKKIREKILPGDVIGFGGNGAVSSMIKVVTDSHVSHVGIISNVCVDFGLSFIQIAESTSIGHGFAGVRFTRMSDHMRDYDGDIWWLPLKKCVREKINIINLVAFIIAQKGKKYDTPQAIGSAIDFLPDQREDLDKLFCSEFVTAAFEHVGILHDINSSEQTPDDVINFDLYSGMYKIKGAM